MHCCWSQDQVVCNGSRVLALPPQLVPEPVLDVFSRHARDLQVWILPVFIRHRWCVDAGCSRTWRGQLWWTQETLLKSVQWHSHDFFICFFLFAKKSNMIIFNKTKVIYILVHFNGKLISCFHTIQVYLLIIDSKIIY